MKSKHRMYVLYMSSSNNYIIITMTVYTVHNGCMGVTQRVQEIETHPISSAKLNLIMH